MRFAYADPPYPRQSARWYKDHPDYAGEVDHTELINRLCRDYPDGWALSTSVTALREVLALCPTDVRVAAWHCPDTEPPGTRGRWHRSWEPLIVRGGRTKYGEGPVVRDVLRCAKRSGLSAVAGRIPGAKPPAFCQWLFMLLGAQPGDELDDLFPGSGAVGAAWQTYRGLVGMTDLPAVTYAKNPSRIARDLRRSGAPDLFGATDV